MASGKASEGADRPGTFGGLSYCEDTKYVVNAAGETVSLRPKSLQVFRRLAESSDTVVSRQALFESIWQDVHVTEDSLTQCVSEIRKSLGPDARSILKTVPKRGYMLVSDPAEDLPYVEADGTAPVQFARYLPWIASVIGLIVLLLVTYLSVDRIAGMQDGAVSTNSHATSVNLQVSLKSESSQFNSDVLLDELGLSLSKYKTVELVNHSRAEYSLDVAVRDDQPNKSYLVIGLTDNQSGSVVFTERVVPNSDSTSLLAARVAALIASPATGAIGRLLLHRGKRKPVEELTRAECYAHGYDCTNCSGELDSVDTRAQKCLSNILATDDKDVRAWGLQSTIYAKQYQWSTNLAEPLRTDVNLRREIAQKAVSAANYAEQLSDGSDSSVYWGMAQAYLAGCEIPKMRNAIDRGLSINANDPGLLGTFGNWLAYSGNWDDGAAMVEKAIALEPKYYKRWWLFAPAKRHFIKGEHQQALDLFERAFNERNWLSHLQLSYTLPYLGRIDEAKAAAEKLQYVFPAINIELALQLYKLYCFPDEYLEKMKKGLQLAGLPERGDSSDVNNIQVPTATITRIGDWSVEYMDLGQGLPVVFVHGTISDYRTWGHYQNPVSEKYRYISYSRRYHGSQPWPDNGERIAGLQHVKDLEDFIEHLELGPVVLVTWSRGSPITTRFILNRPDLVRGLIVYEPNNIQYDSSDPDYPIAARDSFLGSFARFGKLLEQGNSELATEAFLEAAFEKDAGEFASELMAIQRVVLDSSRTMPLMFSPDYEEDLKIECADLARIEKPVLVLAGTRTNKFWQYRARRYSECAANAQLKYVDGVNHAGPIRVPLKVFEHIDHFIKNSVVNKPVQ